MPRRAREQLFRDASLYFSNSSLSDDDEDSDEMWRRLRLRSQQGTRQQGMQRQRPAKRPRTRSAAAEAESESEETEESGKSSSQDVDEEDLAEPTPSDDSGGSLEADAEPDAKGSDVHINIVSWGTEMDCIQVTGPPCCHEILHAVWAACILVHSAWLAGPSAKCWLWP